MDLIAGPWVGEFGWELMSWQAYLRALVHQYKFEYATVFGPPGHDILYSDFADVYVPVVLNGVKDCWRLERADQREKFKLSLQINRLVKAGTMLVRPERFVPIFNQRFLALGDAQKVPPKDHFDVLVHVRKPINKRRGHAWSLPHAERVCERLLKRGFSVAAIGTEAECPEGVENRLNMPLEDLTNLIAAAGVVMGPSSGPMHLASLCRTRHLVWTDCHWYSAIKANNKTRYESVWNPFKTPCTVLEEGWQPNPDLIVMKTEEMLPFVSP
jgi:hypothetical protein